MYVQRNLIPLQHPSGDHYILAESRLAAYYKDPSEYEVVYKRPGKDFVGAKYEPLFPYFEKLTTNDDGSDGAFRLFNADYVSTEDGTGIVHLAPSFGEDDSQAFKKENAVSLKEVYKPFSRTSISGLLFGLRRITGALFAPPSVIVSISTEPDILDTFEKLKPIPSSETSKV